MSKLIAKLLLGAMLFASVAGAGLANDLVGATAPDFALRSTAGNNLRLSEFRSEVVVLTFWAQWCGKCRTAIPVLDSVYQQYNDRGLQMLAVDVDGDRESAANFARENAIGFPVLMDTEQGVSRTYDLNRMPLSVVLDREGMVRFVHVGWTDSDGPELAREVAELLAE